MSRWKEIKENGSLARRNVGVGNGRKSTSMDGGTANTLYTNESSASDSHAHAQHLGIGKFQ